MNVRILLFASLAERLGTQQLSIDLMPNATVGDAIEILTRQYCELSEFRGKIATAVNCKYVHRSHSLGAGDELALIPPVSGG